MPTEDDDLVLPDPAQREAVRSAVYRSARATGLGPDRAHQVAGHTAEHLAGQLEQRGLRLTITWTSDAARQAIENVQRPFDIKDWQPPNTERD